jgi:hypothetical protein
MGSRVLLGIILLITLAQRSLDAIHATTSRQKMERGEWRVNLSRSPVTLATVRSPYPKPSGLFWVPQSALLAALRLASGPLPETWGSFLY